jgi:hypothetical protein
MRRYQPVLLGGLFIGVLSALPIVSAANFCCCLWVVVGGMLSVYLLQQNQPEPVDAGSSALSGLLAGVIGALIYVVLSFVMLSVSGDMMEDQVRQAIENSPQIPAEVRDRILGLFTGGRLVWLIAGVSLPVYGVAGMLGGLLGLAVFKKKVVPPPAQP